MICRAVANDRFSVWKLGITHVLNAAHGKMHSQGCHRFYGSTVEYYGVPADDSPSFNLSVYFHPCADYIKEVLSSPGGKTVSGFKLLKKVLHDHDAIPKNLVLSKWYL